jgi:hypothetical protein
VISAAMNKKNAQPLPRLANIIHKPTTPSSVNPREQPASRDEEIYDDLPFNATSIHESWDVLSGPKSTLPGSNETSDIAWNKFNKLCEKAKANT